MRPGLERWALILLAAIAAACGGDDDTSRPPATATPTVLAATSTATLAPSTPTGLASTSTPTGTPAVVEPTSTPVDTDTPTSTSTPTDTETLTPTETATVTETPTITETPTVTRTATHTSTPIPPELTFLGVARADELLQVSTLVDDQGRPVFERPTGQGMTLILEGRRGGAPLEVVAYDGAGGTTGMEVLVSRPLGDGSPEVCDLEPGQMGGVPGIDPPEFSDDPATLDAIADLACRVEDGTGHPRGRLGSGISCTREPRSLNFSYAAPASQMQYCLPIARAWRFPPGDTVVAARLRDRAGVVSETREIVVRVGEPRPFPCAGGLGDREVSIIRPPSRWLTPESGGEDVSTGPWEGGPLRLCTGPDRGDGRHDLTLTQTAIVGAALVDGGVLCARIAAGGSFGTLDCAGGTAHDVLVLQPVDPPDLPALETGLGAPAPAGSATLVASVSLVHLPAGATPADCATAPFFGTTTVALTTAQATARLVGDAGESVAEVSASGAPFDCAQWSEGGAGAFALPTTAAGGEESDVALVAVMGE